MKVAGVPLVLLVVVSAATTPLLFSTPFGAVFAVFFSVFWGFLICFIPLLRKNRTHNYFRSVVCGYLLSVLIFVEIAVLINPELIAKNLYYVMNLFIPEIARKFYIYSDNGENLYFLSRLAAGAIVQFVCFISMVAFLCALPFRYEEYVSSKSMWERYNIEGRANFLKLIFGSLLTIIFSSIFLIVPSFINIGYWIDVKTVGFLIFAGAYYVFMTFYTMIGFESAFGGWVVLMSRPNAKRQAAGESNEL